MGARETLTLGWSGEASSLPQGGPAFMLVDEPVTRPAARAPRPARRVIDAQVISSMRDLVLASFLGSQFAQDRDNPGPTPYTTEGTRDCRPAGLTDADLKTRGAEDLKRITTRIHASETRPKKKGGVLLGPFAYQDAHVIKAIGGLAPEYGQWLRYAYGDSRQWEDEQGAVVALWKRAEPLFGKVQTKTLKNIRALAHLATQAGKERMNSGREIHDSEKLMQLLQVKRGNFDVQWAPRWKLYAEQIERLDRDALEALAKALGDFDFVIDGRGVGPEVECGSAQSISDAAVRAKKSVGVGLKTGEAAILRISGKLLPGGAIDACWCTDIRPPAPGQSDWTIRAEPCAACDRGAYALEPLERLELRLERLREQLVGRGLVLELGKRFVEPK
ncbi:bacteriophage antitermination protein Q [Pseudomonas sp. BCRC 81390]|uniref:bacteriophage antitermination protein Q n=1 Tax=Pseudomonas sp. BCRC 81390 TaxID=3054778 RepID=UPI002596E3DD|nr:bacteriophage antitermination protein Q [Pseudomonas sp. BCRC 81390]MDM3884661.1 bacteriophage antitermination protein Q [Pseudomonas sp. BCRC 81390]